MAVGVGSNARRSCICLVAYLENGLELRLKLGVCAELIMCRTKCPALDIQFGVVFEGEVREHGLVECLFSTDLLTWDSLVHGRAVYTLAD